jgi:hypothetical protein
MRFDANGEALAKMRRASRLLFRSLTLAVSLEKHDFRAVFLSVRLALDSASIYNMNTVTKY